jgi:hypothetical protein
MRLVKWKSEGCKPVLAVHPSLEDLYSRHEIDVFRDKDDLDWFVGAIFLADEIGQVLIMRHDGNPPGATDFYVDLACDESLAIGKISEIYRLTDDEIFWKLGSDTRQFR